MTVGKGNRTSAKILSLRRGNSAAAIERAARIDLMFMMNSLLKHRVGCTQPRNKHFVHVEFRTEVEAVEFQRLMHALQRRKR